MNTWKKLLFLAVLIFVSGTVLMALEVGDDAPPFVLTDLDRNYVFSKNLFGQGWILVDFYSTTCVACNEELPYIEDLYEKRKDSGFDVVVLATDSEGSAVVKPFFAQRPSPLTILLDRYQKAVENYGVEALPTVFLVNPEGKIAYTSTGFHEGLIEEIEAFLD